MCICGIGRFDAESFNQDGQVWDLVVRFAASAQASPLPVKPIQEASDGLRIIVKMGSEMLSKPVIRIHNPLSVRALRLWKAKRTQHVLTPPLAYL